MIGTYDTEQASGALTQIIKATETDWGVRATSPNAKYLNVIPGETLDSNLAIYQSRQIRPDRMTNQDLRGSQRPAGTLPFELGPTGINQEIFQALGWLVGTTGSGPYVHTVRGWGDVTSRGANPFPPGITHEKGFLDLPTPQFIAFYGGRANTINFNFNVDAVCNGTVDMIYRQASAFSPTSIFNALTPTDLSGTPYTAVQINVYEGSSLLPLATATQIQLAITNNMKPTFALGSPYAVNCKPGSRMTTGSGTFLFNSTALYNKAIAGTPTQLQITATNGVYTHDFLMKNVQFTPNGSVPKISDDSGLTVPLAFKATKDVATQTDITVTITTSEAVITN